MTKAPLGILEPLNIGESAYQTIGQGLQMATELCFRRATLAGWWTDLETNESLINKRNRPEMLMLMVSEISEAMEGLRKNLMDDHIPSRKMEEVELADLLIRVFDYAGANNLDLAGAFFDKLAYNAQRADHKVENRKLANGKKF